MRPTARVVSLCLTVLLLLLSAASCRNRDFTPAEPPAEKNGQGEVSLPADFQCWVVPPDGEEYRAANAADLYEAVTRIYERSETVDAFPEKDGKLLLIFCTGGTAPETTIPAYQLPNATLHGVYSLFPDDTGWYGDDLITAHVHTFRLKEGSYESLRDLAEAGKNME